MPDIDSASASAGSATEFRVSDELSIALGALVAGPVRADQMYRALAELDKKLTARLDASERAVELLHADQVRVPTMLDREITHVRDVINTASKGEQNLASTRLDSLEHLMNEKFIRVDTLFTSLATLTDKLSLANATALTAALSAAEKAVGEQNRSSSLAITKSEQGMLEALKQLQQNFQTEIRAITAVMTTIQSRLDRGEGTSFGAQQHHSDTRLDHGSMVSMIAMAIAAAALLFGIWSSHSNAVAPVTQYVPAPVAPITVPSK